MSLKLNPKLGIAVGIVLLLVVALYPFSGVKVVIVNDGSKAITNLTISFRGGKFALPQLDSGSSHEFTVRPTGETDLDITFEDAEGKSRGKKIDVYLAKNIGGTLTIKIDSSVGVTWINETKLSYF